MNGRERTGYCYPMHVIRWYFKHVIDDFAKEFRLKKECACVCVDSVTNSLVSSTHSTRAFSIKSFDPRTHTIWCTRKVVNLSGETTAMLVATAIDIIMIVKQLWVWERVIGQIALASIWAVKLCILTLYFSLSSSIILQHHRKIGGL